MHGCTPDGSRATLAAIALMLLAATSAPAHAAGCDPTGADAVTVATARTVAESACSCGSAASATAWRLCVRAALAPSVGVTLSKSCAHWVERVEARSTCGRPGRVACCRTSASGSTRALLLDQARCTTPGGGTACASPIPFLADACVPGGCAPAPVCGNYTVDPGEDCDPPDGLYCDTACHACTTELGCVAPTVCGNGTLDVGEDCDPPNGTTCSSTCSACAPAAPGELPIGCTSGSTGAYASALPDKLLVTWTDRTPGGSSHTVARRLGNDGTPADAVPVLVSGTLSPSGALGGSAAAASADGDEFYVVWATYRDYVSLWGARRIPVTGAPTDAPAVIQSSFGIGSCRTGIAGPVHLAPMLDDSGFHSTWRVIYSCSGSVLAETLIGVGNFFTFPPPGNISSGPAPIVRGASDVAAAWWNIGVASISPPVFFPTLDASFVAPGTPQKIELMPGSSTVPPALAAVGDTFFVFHTDGSELRAIRFTRAGGVLDPSGGILVTTASSAIRQVVAAGDGSSAIVAWVESDGTVRATRVAPDGTLPNATATTVASTNGAIDLAANATTALLVLTRSENTSTAVRGVLLPAGF